MATLETGRTAEFRLVGMLRLALWWGTSYMHVISLAEQSQVIDRINDEADNEGENIAQVSNPTERIYYRIAPHSGAITSVSRGSETLHIEYYE
jgi:hypothetical protein